MFPDQVPEKCCSTMFGMGLILLLLLGFQPTLAVAVPTVYSYTGNPYTIIDDPNSGYTSANHVTAALTVANALAPNATYEWGVGGIGTPTATETLTAFVISDQDLTFSLTDNHNIFVGTDSQGEIASWFVGGCAEPCSSAINIVTVFDPPNSPLQAIDASTAFSFGPILAHVSDDPGVWTTADLAPIPQPATLFLFGTTVAGLSVARWRQRSRKFHYPEGS
jgi:hypothetical protein